MNTQLPTDEQPTTVKIPAITETNELEYAQRKYDAARDTMIRERTPESIEAFTKANELLVEIQDKYRIGYRLMLERKTTEAPSRVESYSFAQRIISFLK